MSDRPTLLLEHHLKELKLPTFLREYGKIAAQCASEGVDHPDYLLRLAEFELIDRHHRMVARRIKAARFPALNPNPLKGACERPPEEAKGCTFESEIMVLNQKTCHRKGAPNRCYHVTTLTASKSPSTIPPGSQCRADPAGHPGRASGFEPTRRQPR